MKLESFLTYDDVEIFPGPRVNLVIGPNGTGKSSIVCALCLGLAGKPKMLGRAAKIGSFVKHGAESGMIQLELKNTGEKNKGRNWLVTRYINANNKCTWTLNGKSCSEADVKRLAEDLSIQVGNLCQFLPQDMVQEFSHMNSMQMLVATQEAVSGQELVDKHKELVELQGKQQQSGSALDTLKEKLTSLTQQNERVQRDVERMESREKLVGDLEMMKKKLPWMLFQREQSKAKEMKEENKAAKDELAVAQANQGPLKDELEEAKKEEERMNKLRKATKTEADKAGGKQNRLARKMGDATAEVEQVDIKLDEMKNNLKKVKRDIGKKQRQLDGEKEALAKMADPAAVAAEVKELKNDVSQLDAENNALQDEEDKLKRNKGKAQVQINQTHAKLQQINNVANSKMQALKKIDHQAYDVGQRTRTDEMRSRFKGEVFGPILQVRERKREGGERERERDRDRERDRERA